MIIDLTKEELIDMLKSSSPDYSLFEDQQIRSLGRYFDSTGWQWNSKINNLSEQEIYSLYKKCKKSFTDDE